MKHVPKVLFAMAVITLAACKGGGDTQADAAANGNAVGANDNVSTTGIQGDNSVTTGSPLEAEQRRLLGELVVYFDYDQAEIRQEFSAMLQAHGRQLSQNPNMQVRLEGHTDERGSREYNIGLGERRAQAVRRVLMLQGATAQQLSTVSYGEERPAQTGSDDEAWRLNRRVELVYR
jgi:peptidoglycan-associated lipoprotein